MFKSKAVWGILFSCFLIGAFCSCKKSVSKEEQERTSTSESVHEDKQETSLKQNNEIGELTVRCTRLEDNVSGLQNRVNDFKDQLSVIEEYKNNVGSLVKFVIISFSCIFILLVIFILLIWKRLKDLQNRSSKMEIKISQLESKVNNVLSQMPQISYSNIEKSIKRLIESEIIKQISKIVHIPDAQNKKNEPVSLKAESNQCLSRKKDYWGINSGKDIFRTYEVLVDECVYCVDHMSETVAQFKPINFKKIRDNYNVKAIIDFEGDCMLSEASDFKTISPGEAVLERSSEGDYWHVTKNAKVRLVK